jgi:ATP dependent DNA ligase C terminal region
LIFGYYHGLRLLYAGRTRSGFTPAMRESLMRRFRGLENSDCPFANLPEARSGRWGETFRPSRATYDMATNRQIGLIGTTASVVIYPRQAWRGPGDQRLNGTSLIQ